VRQKVDWRSLEYPNFLAYPASKQMIRLYRGAGTLGIAEKVIVGHGQAARKDRHASQCLRHRMSESLGFERPKGT